MIFLEKLISKFNISSKVAKGNTRQLVICSKCKHKNIVSNRNKLVYSKITSILCSKCKNPIRIGDIFNFRTGTKLNDINDHHNQDTLDNYIWNDNYDKI